MKNGALVMKIDTCHTCKYFVNSYIQIDDLNVGFCNNRFIETHAEYCCIEYYSEVEN